MIEGAPAKSAADVLCVGYACTDINFSVAHHPGPDEKLRARRMSTCGGGPAANAAVAIARLGGRAAFCGYLGNDAFGEAHLSELQNEGVDASPVACGPYPSPVAAVTIKPDGSRSIVDFRDPGALLPEDALQLKDYPARVLLLDGHQPLLSAKLVEQARMLGIPSVLDAGSLHDGTEILFRSVDYLIASEKFARQLTQESDPRLALAALDGAAPVVAVTWGAHGVFWQDREGQHHLPAFDVEAVDTTGAGDAFHGAFTYGLAQGMRIRDNMRCACAAGALACLKTGARNALPRMEAVARLLEANAA